MNSEKYCVLGKLLSVFILSLSSLACWVVDNENKINAKLWVEGQENHHPIYFSPNEQLTVHWSVEPGKNVDPASFQLRHVQVYEVFDGIDEFESQMFSCSPAPCDVPTQGTFTISPTDSNVFLISVGVDIDGERIYTEQQISVLLKPDLPLASIPFDDANLVACIEATGAQTIEGIHQLYCPDRGITSLAGLEYLKQLRSVDLSGNPITDLTPLLSSFDWRMNVFNGKEMQSLIVSDTLIDCDDLQSFYRLTENNWLSMTAAHANCQGMIRTSDVSIPDDALQTCLNPDNISPPYYAFYYTNLSCDGVHDLSGIEYFTHLTSLRLGNTNHISDIHPLAALEYLVDLNLDNIPNVDFSPIALLTGLHRLSVSGTQMTDSDTSYLTGLTSLKSLGLANNVLTQSDFLTNLSQLERLWIGGNRLTELHGIANATGLTEFSAYNNRLTDVSVLADKVNLTQLYLAENRIVDIEPLRALTSLNSLTIERNQITNIDALGEHTQLRYLSLGENPFTDFTPLHGLGSLVNLTATAFPNTIGIQGLESAFNPVVNPAHLPSANFSSSPDQSCSFLESVRPTFEEKGIGFVIPVNCP